MLKFLPAIVLCTAQARRTRVKFCSYQYIPGVVPGENSYLQRTLVMLRGKTQDSLNINKHLDLWNGFVSVLISGFLTPPPALLCLHTQFQLFNFNKLILIFYYFRVRVQGFSGKKVCLGFLVNYNSLLIVLVLLQVQNP